VDSVANKNAVPSIIGINTIWYYLMRRMFRGQTMKFTRIGRTAAIGLIYNLASYSFYASPKVRE